MGPDRGHGGRWRVVLALVGLASFLIAGETAQAEDSSPVAERSEAVQGGAPGETADAQSPAKGPGWHPTLLQAEQASKAECTDGDDCRSEQRDYSDLRAQWQAALAAKGQAQFALVQTIMMIFGTGIAAMGTWFVVQTLQETRRAVEEAAEANRIALAGQRPWVLVEAKTAGAVVVSALDICIPMVLSMKNVGKTPAVGAIAHAQIIQKPVDGSLSDQAKVVCATFCAKHARKEGRVGDIVGQDGEPINITHGSMCLVETLHETVINEARVVELYIAAMVFYRSPDRPNEHFLTCVLYDALFEQLGGMSRRLVIANRSIPVCQVQFRRIGGGYVT